MGISPLYLVQSPVSGRAIGSDFLDIALTGTETQRMCSGTSVALSVSKVRRIRPSKCYFDEITECDGIKVMMRQMSVASSCVELV